MDNLSIIKDILATNLDINPDSVTSTSTFDSLGIDSLDMVELICELEDRLHIDFGDPEGLKTVDELLGYLETLL
ncbi:MAG: phosphopantetheine-binding protein [Eggerthellaceae bacterium]|jgi:acyl carrier protein|nr:phosphopantetheine-binding protein [Eggerthellaceae bacterium]